MNLNEAKVLIKNLLGRIEDTDGGYRLVGRLTNAELQAIEFGLKALEGQIERDVEVGEPPAAVARFPELGTTDLDRTAVDADLRADIRMCLDFGTAMSKATLVEDEYEGGQERTEVLQLGVAAGQQSHDYLLLSSVYISNDGVLMFGESAVERSHQEGMGGGRRRLDNIKRRISEDGWDEKVSPEYNPTNTPVTYGDMVLAYLTYFTWTANACLRELGYGMLKRRFALPAFVGAKRREVEAMLREGIGKAQLLADTFGEDLSRGIELRRFIAGARELAEDRHDYSFVGESLTEPAGAAGSMLSWRNKY